MKRTFNIAQMMSMTIYVFQSICGISKPYTPIEPIPLLLHH